ncbi:hypothetical protein TELCIR_23888 [Teladorsagia circumcincta]|uniref:Uncharacterized protein n=1 Tax=Teladorsagia circumcincta TaxID=45464 RepID=A0A2G9T9T2_TELCI|nr:hypothetical protein TELCIR_23888 [Teladorsagia circumcincta]
MLMDLKFIDQNSNLALADEKDTGDDIPERLETTGMRQEADFDKMQEVKALMDEFNGPSAHRSFTYVISHYAVRAGRSRQPQRYPTGFASPPMEP